VSFRLTVLSMLVVGGLAGCGVAPPEAEFALSAGTQRLVPPARNAVAATLHEHFGTPQHLVAWKRLPIDYGQLNGTVTAIDKSGGIQVELTEPSGEPAALDGRHLSGAGLLWTSGDYQNLVGVGKEGEDIPISFRVTKFDAEKQTLEFATSPPVDPAQLGAAAPGDTFELGGFTLQQGRKLYMQHCTHCHGVAGDGNGPTAKYLNPRPRDYRLGIFKFTSTRQGDEMHPTREDLVLTIKQGIPGTYMPSFMLLPDEEVRALVEYVRWLAIRGELEKKLVGELELDYAKSVLDGMNSEERNAMLQQLDDYLQSELPETWDFEADNVAQAWIAADSEENLVFPKSGREESVAGLAKEVGDWLVESGGTLSRGVYRRVVQEEGGPALQIQTTSGDAPVEGQVLIWADGKLRGHKYQMESVSGSLVRLSPLNGAPPLDAANAPASGDTVVFGAEEPPDRLSYVLLHGGDFSHLSEAAAANPGELQDELLAQSIQRGRSLYLGPKAKCATCHGPQGRGDGEQTLVFQKIPGSTEDYPEPGLYDKWDNKIQPRDLTRGIYRGGRRPIDLYRRIYAGIKGTPMPPFGATLSDDEIWDLVNYVLSVPYENGTGSSNGETRKQIASTAR
jgi:mono/diheme cytochrome c family protein